METNTSNKIRGLMTMWKCVLLLFVSLFVITSCSQHELSEHGEIAKQYLEESGYEVITHRTDSSKEFSQVDLFSQPTQQIWSVQYTEPDDYLDKKIDTVAFTIKNHPLDHIFNMGKTDVTVYMYNNEVIGGWSFPISEADDVVGPPSSLHGKTAEEIQGSYSRWLRDWEAKYQSGWMQHYKLEHPPKLTVSSAGNMIEAVIGTTSWYSYEADSERPSELIDHQIGKLSAEPNDELILLFDQEPIEYDISLYDLNTPIIIEGNKILISPHHTGLLIFEVHAKWLEGNAWYAFAVDVNQSP